MKHVYVYVLCMNTVGLHTHGGKWNAVIYAHLKVTDILPHTQIQQYQSSGRLSCPTLLTYHLLVF